MRSYRGGWGGNVHGGNMNQDSKMGGGIWTGTNVRREEGCNMKTTSGEQGGRG